jgi:cell division protein FtsW
MDYRQERLDGANHIADYSTDKSIRRGPLDIPFLLLVLILLTIGVVMLLSASYARAYYAGKAPTYYFVRQLAFAVLGVAAMFFMSRIPMGLYRRISMWVLLGALFLLLLVPVIGTASHGSRRWLSVGGITLQPSEIAKIGVILAFSDMICKYKGAMKTFKYGVVPFAVILVVIAGLLVLEPHLSATIIILLVGASLMYLGGVRWQWFAAGGGLAVGAVLVYLKVFGYASDRITAWRDPLADTSDTAYQIMQSLYSIGSGGLTGLGLGMSRQKYLYLPEEHNDFIFSIVCEELGYVGAMVILILFALLIIRGYWLAMHSRDRYSFLVCAGITTLLAIQVIFNVAVVTNLIPCTGVSLPFFSSGGTALLIQLGEMGIILSMSRDIPAKRVPAPAKTE